MTVRVLRILEYVYDDFETAEKDMDNWAIPANGTKKFGKTTIYAATTGVRTYTKEEEEAND